MVNKLTEINVYGVALVPVIIGLVQLLKKSGLSKKYLPASAIILGLLFSFFYLAPDEPKKAFLLGIVLGLSAMGLYSGTKTTVLTKSKKI